jgi:uncharacterized UPF0160 family protein
MVTIMSPDYFELELNKRQNAKGVYVVTHNNNFGVDDAFPVALLRLFFKDIVVVRTEKIKILKKAMSNKATFVIGAGGQMNPQKRNFDNTNSKTSVVKSLFAYLYYGYENDVILRDIYNGLITEMDNLIKNRKKNLPEESFLDLEYIISGFNRDEVEEQNRQYIKAVNTAYMIIGNEIERITSRVLPVSLQMLGAGNNDR